MSLRWFRADGPKGPADVAAYRAQLEPFGIVLKDDCGQAIYFVDEESGDFMMEIGSLVYWPHLGTMNCFPRLRLDDDRKVTLLGSASKSVREGRFSKADNWTPLRGKRGEHKGKPGWRSEIVVAIQPGGEIWDLIARSRESIDCQDLTEVLADTTVLESQGAL